MKNKKIAYTEPDEPLVFGKRVHDRDLPSPSELAAYLRPKGQKITITLDPGSVNFFKSEAQKSGAKYQSMIRELITQYVKRHTIHNR
jgi:predicted DNA binding CopG/RHH family protein